MKINLTKLLEKSKIEKNQDKSNKDTGVSYYVKTIDDTTSTENAYSFELEKETFILKK